MTDSGNNYWSEQLFEATTSNDVRWLLDHGADINSRGKDGLTPLMRAAHRGLDSVMNTLLERGADVNLTDNRGRTAPMWAIDDFYDSVLHLQVLLDKRIDPTITNRDGRTPERLAGWRKIESRVKLLLDQGADINSKDNNGSTALMLAAEFGNDLVVNLLMQYGADVDITDCNGNTALNLAEKSGHTKVVQLLKIPQTKASLSASHTSQESGCLKQENRNTLPAATMNPRSPAAQAASGNVASPSAATPKNDGHQKTNKISGPQEPLNCSKCGAPYPNHEPGCPEVDPQNAELRKRWEEGFKDGKSGRKLDELVYSHDSARPLFVQSRCKSDPTFAMGFSMGQRDRGGEDPPLPIILTLIIVPSVIIGLIIYGICHMDDAIENTKRATGITQYVQKKEAEQKRRKEAEEKADKERELRPNKQNFITTCTVAKGSVIFLSEVAAKSFINLYVDKEDVHTLVMAHYKLSTMIQLSDEKGVMTEFQYDYKGYKICKAAMTSPVGWDDIWLVNVEDIMRTSCLKCRRR